MATYYVDADAGDDGAAGTSEATAWQTLAKVAASTFAAGDSILLKRGCLWRESLLFPSSGAQGARITIGAYGSGDRPLLKGSDTKANGSFAVYDAPTNTYRVAHTADRSDCNAVWEAGEKLTSASSIANCQATAGSSYYDHAGGYAYVHSAQADPSPLTNGLAYEAAKRPAPLDDNDKNWLIWQDLDVRHGYSALSAHLVQGDDNIVRRCYYKDNSNHHLSFYGARNLAEDCTGLDCAGGAFLWYSAAAIGNVFRRLTISGTKSWTGSGIQVHGEAQNNIAEHCVLSQSVVQTPTRVGAVAITTADTTGNVIKYCQISGSWKCAVEVHSGANNTVFYGNLVYDTSFQASQYACVVRLTTTGFLCYANTFALGAQGAIGLEDTSTGTFRNNVVTITNDWYLYSDAASILTSENNVFNGSLRATPFYWQAVQYNLANYRTASGQDLLSAVADPLLANVGADQYWPQPGSPCIAAGAWIEGYNQRLHLYSLWPDVVRTLVARNIGAYTSQAQICSPVRWVL